ncbi:YdeI/OmpD-associated family protein [Pedobacter sp.]|uniref:YdeI/OmpD-associated family protein n=1 Tax=Pedobacter sp. TaxID=1411316 RepID=UPI003D7F8861
MVTFNASLERFERMGEKTGWTYITVPQAIAQVLKPGCKKSYRVKGKFDHIDISGMAMIPMGEGAFIIAVKAALRKQLQKEEGAVIKVELEEDLHFTVEMPEEMEMCLLEERHLMDRFLAMPLSHQHYFINWYTSAKTEKTKVKRLIMMVNAMESQLDFGAMIRASKDAG